MIPYAKILADSISPNGDRLTTFEIKLARIVLAEFNTHRDFSRNSASSRAIPVKKMLKMVMEEPYIPSSWGKNQKGMQADKEVDKETAEFAQYEWLSARDSAVFAAEQLLGLGIHKQITNRLLEPFMYHTVIITATNFSNFFNLRNHPMAHPDIHVVAKLMQELYESSTPWAVDSGQWHLPLVTGIEGGEIKDDWMKWVKISSGRCARVSYLTHDGVRDLLKDIGLHDGLLGNGHMSPLEHPARPMTLVELETYRMYHYTLANGTVFDSRIKFIGSASGVKIVNERKSHFCGNLDGWRQYRKLIPNEHDKMAQP